MNSENLQFKAEEDVFIGNSPEAKHVNRAIKKYSRVDSHVMIVGETGTGKEFAARRIHNLSGRKFRPFVVVNCAALGYTIDSSELYGREEEKSGTIQRTIGLLERANQGTLFLDNISEASSESQFELLQVIRENRFRRVGGADNILLDVRIISSANHDMREDIDNGRFRKDLYFQLNSLTISIPALKERKQDIPELFIFFLKNYCREREIEIPAVPAEIFESILEYDWDGNIRELKNAVHNLVMMSPKHELSTDYLPFEIKRHPLDFLEIGNLKGAISEVETYLIRKALVKFSGNQVKAARLLGIPEATLRFKIKKYAIENNF